MYIEIIGIQNKFLVYYIANSKILNTKKKTEQNIVQSRKSKCSMVRIYQRHDLFASKWQVPLDIAFHSSVQRPWKFQPLLAMLLESQSSPSYSPSPEVAQVLWMYQCR